MFDLEEKIREWEKEFYKYESFEEGLVLDMEQHLRDEIAELTRAGLSEADAFETAVSRIGSAETIAAEYRKNRELALDRRRPWRPARFVPGLLWNTIKIAMRKINRQKGYSFINIFGLALGMVCFILLMVWVRDEISWDRFHKNYENIYRVQSGLIVQPGAIAPHLEANYPEIVSAARLYFGKSRSLRYGDKVFEENGFVFADPSIFKIFTIPFVSGDPDTALAGPDSAVLTQSAGLKYFGRENPIGRILTVDGRFTVRVTGIVKDPPRNSDIRFEVLAAFRFIDHYIRNPDASWGAHNYFTYILLREGTDYQTVIEKIAPLRRVMDDEPSAWLLTLVPLERIHLYEDGTIKLVAIFAMVAVFILAIAGFNFVNLTTAKSGHRAKEIAIRKVAGAVRDQLLRQFLSESVLLSLLALLMALTIVVQILPHFNTLAGKELSPGDIFAPGFFLFIFGTAVAIGLAAGAYPAVLISSFRPVGLLQGGTMPTGRSAAGFNLRKALVFAQFSISIGLMIAMVLVEKQVAFIRNHDLGIRKENVIILPVKDPILDNRDAFVNELTNHPGVIDASFASSFPSNKRQVIGVDWEGKDPGSNPPWQFIETDDRYLDTLGIKLLEGRNFPKIPLPDRVAPYFILNQKAVAEMGVKNPVGKKFSAYRTEGTVIGVIKNFHFKLLREDIGPLVLFVGPYNIRYILIKINPGSGQTAGIITWIEEIWHRHAPGMPFSYEFLDAAWQQNYRAERELGLGFKYFTFLGILISCLGLVGLVSAVMEQKRKEIGIRKVLGATLSTILFRIHRVFLTPILLSNLIAWPLAYWAMNRWFQGFAYHTDIPLGLFPVASISTLALALLTVSGLAIRAASANPVDSLRHE